MGTSQSWAGCKTGSKEEGAGRPDALQPPWAPRGPYELPLPSPGTMERLHVLSLFLF